MRHPRCLWELKLLRNFSLPVEVTGHKYYSFVITDGMILCLWGLWRFWVRWFRAEDYGQALLILVMWFFDSFSLHSGSDIFQNGDHEPEVMFLTSNNTPFNFFGAFYRRKINIYIFIDQFLHYRSVPFNRQHNGRRLICWRKPFIVIGVLILQLVNAWFIINNARELVVRFSVETTSYSSQ